MMKWGTGREGAMPQITVTLRDRVNMARDAVLIARGKQEAIAKDLDKALDDLAIAEAEVLGKAPGWEDAQLSGLIADGENPHYTVPEGEAPPPPPEIPPAPAEGAPSEDEMAPHVEQHEGPDDDDLEPDPQGGKKKKGKG
jgi:hypothetical protein